MDAVLTTIAVLKAGAACLPLDPGQPEVRYNLAGVLERAGRPAEVPSLVWMTPAPGCEEAVIRAIDEGRFPPRQIMGYINSRKDEGERP